MYETPSKALVFRKCYRCPSCTAHLQFCPSCNGNLEICPSEICPSCNDKLKICPSCNGNLKICPSCDDNLVISCEPCEHAWSTEVRILNKLIKQGGQQHVLKLFGSNKTLRFVDLPFAMGGDLFDAVKQGMVDQDRARYLFKSIAAGLAFLHEHGIVHRDVKAENIVIMEDGTARIVDFGHAVVGDPASRKELTTATKSYAPPECFKRGKRELGPMDVWCLGVVLYVMCCGFNPWHGEDVEPPKSDKHWSKYYAVQVPAVIKFFLDLCLHGSPDMRSSAPVLRNMSALLM